MATAAAENFLSSNSSLTSPASDATFKTLNAISADAGTSASLIGRLGQALFRLSTTPVPMSLTGSCFSSDSAPRPFHHGIRRRGGTIFWATLPPSPHNCCRPHHQLRSSRGDRRNRRCSSPLPAPLPMTRAGLGTPPLPGGTVKAPKQYLRSQPNRYRSLFEDDARR